MIHSLSLFLAPENAAAQATLNSPPALEGPAVRKRGNIGSRARFMAAIAGFLISGPQPGLYLPACCSD